MKREVPRIRAHYGSIRCSSDTVQQLRAAGSANDKRAADLIEAWLAEDAVPIGSVAQLLLLSSPDADDALLLPGEIKNTKQTSSGRPMAWVVLSKQVPLAALANGPSSTDEIDSVLGNKAFEPSGG